MNVLKGVWYCYACHASGGVDKKYVPSTDDLLSMLEPERSVRVYPDTYLTLFDTDEGYWQTRFSPWLCWTAALGRDPVSGAATFPVYTPQGRLAGVGKRRENEEPKYKYPVGWSASRVLGGAELLPARKFDHILLVEGYADAASLWEVGIPAMPTFGAGLHLPQLEMLFRRSPKLVLLGFDMDKAGSQAVSRSHHAIKEVITRIERVKWPEKDPAACSPKARIDAVCESVGTDVYVADWLNWQTQMMTAYNESRP